MNITIVCDVLGDETNGTTIASMNLIRYLQSKNHNVKILCADQDKKGLPNFFVVPNLSLGKILDKIVKKNNVTLAKPDDEIIKKAIENTDHIHIMLPFILGRRTLRIARQKGISITAGFHAQAENLSAHVRLQNSEFINKAIYKNFYNRFYRYVDAIHYPSQFMKEIFEKSIKVQTNGYVISNGVNQNIKKMNVVKPNELKDKIVILTTGRLSVEKSQSTLIKAIKYSKYKDDIQLIIAGQGPLENKLKRMAKGLKNYPIFKVFEREKMPEIINMCDIYVHPALMELEGIACLEAICCGKLVIVNDSPKSATKSYAINEKCIFKHKNPKDLAKTIDYWIEHQQKKEDCEEKYLRNANLYSQDECMAKMEKMIFEVHENQKNNKTVL